MSPNPSATLLLADDDAPSLRLLSLCLKSAGYATIETRSGQEAVQLAIEKQPDLAILDINMPGMNGTEAARLIRRETDVPFIFLSAHDESAIVRQAVEEGALGYLVKPIELPRIVPTVQTALSRANELHRLRESEANLATALSVGRETSIAIGLIMERYRLDQNAAFEALRAKARAQRRKIADLAEEIVRAADTLNAFDPPHREKS